MDFFVTSNLNDLEKIPKTFPSVVLFTDNWNDYGFITLHRLYYFDKQKKEYEIGEVKILHETSNKTRLPTYFNELTEEFCSLGQDISYYKKLKELGNEVAADIYKGLKDIAIDEAIYKKFEFNVGFFSSLIRFSQAEKALNEGKKYFINTTVEKIFKFRFQYKLPNADSPHIFDFDFDQNSHLPYRLNAIIGKNGTGKTEMLAKIAALVSGFEKSNNQNFSPARPSFSKIIAISYSVFDEFDRPKGNDRTFSYEYCGIRDDKNRILSPSELKSKFNKNYIELEKRNRINVWKKVIEEIIEPDHRNVLESLVNGDEISLSSGQYLIIMTITDVIANIEEESLLLFDEPETHLHPNALSNLVRMLNTLLDEFKSFAILSTHSPIIIQEIPSKYISLVKRTKNEPSVRPLHIESFGENLTSITNEVFDVRSSESNYKFWFQKMAESMNYDEILDLFDSNNNSLSYNAMTYLNTLFKDDK